MEKRMRAADRMPYFWAGSCSEATLRQIRSYEKGGYPCYRIDAGRVLRGEETAEHVWNIVKMHPGENMLVYSSDSPEQVRKIQEEGKEKISFMLEQLTAELAARAAGSGYRRLIVQAVRHQARLSSAWDTKGSGLATASRQVYR